MVCKNPRIFRTQYVAYIDTVWHARDYKVKYVVATSGFCFQLCMSRSGREGHKNCKNEIISNKVKGVQD